MKDYSKDFQDLEENNNRLFECCEDVGASFMEIHGEAIKSKKLTSKEKEFVALGIAIAIRCEGCIISHVRASIKEGAGLEEIAEVVEVAILMGGGPSTVYGGKALEVAEQLLK